MRERVCVCSNIHGTPSMIIVLTTMWMNGVHAVMRKNALGMRAVQSSMKIPSGHHAFQINCIWNCATPDVDFLDVPISALLVVV